MRTYATIVFIDGSDYEEVESMGTDELTTHLLQWEDTEARQAFMPAHNTSGYEPWGTDDWTHEQSGYVVSWNGRMGYAALQRIIEHVDYPHEPGRLYDCLGCETVCHCNPDPRVREEKCIYCA